MEFKHVLDVVTDEPVFETGLLLAGAVDPDDVRKQLSRWVRAGRIYQLRRGLYTLAPPFQKVKPHPFLVANRMVRSSYVSCQSALAYFGLIPEYVPVVTSVTAGRPGHWETPLGAYDFRHVKPELFRGYQMVDLGGGNGPSWPRRRKRCWTWSISNRERIHRATCRSCVSRTWSGLTWRNCAARLNWPAVPSCGGPPNR